MDALKHILNTFQTISLSEMDAVGLMDRMDTKFVFSETLLPFVLENLYVHYKLLQIQDERISSYKTLYFDTPDLKFYSDHHNGKANRHKVRYRNYNAGESGFLEVKFKNNKGQTSKQRMVHVGLPEQWNEAAVAFLNDKMLGDVSLLKPQVWVNYKRITLVDNAMNERVTIDLGLEFSKDLYCCTQDKLVILEIKSPRHSDSRVATLMKKLGIKEISLSKYCLAINRLLPQVKKNNFKATLAVLNKLSYDTSFSPVANS